MGPGHYEIGGPGGSDWGLLDHGIHLADSFSWLMNSDIASVFGRGALSGGGPLTEYLVMNFENGALGTIVYNSSTFSSDLPAEGIFSWSPEWTEWKVGDGQRQVSGTWAEHPASIRVHGTHGALRIYYYANKMFLFAEGRREQIQVLDQPMPRHFGLQMQSFAQSILDDRSPETNGWDGVKALRAVLGAYESSKKQRVIFVGTDSQAILREHDSRDFKKGELA
jgi:predicted dehydrogenase